MHPKKLAGVLPILILAMGLGLAAPAATLAWTFEATYIWGPDGNLTYSEDGILDGALRCDDGWLTEDEPPVSTLFSGHRATISIDALSGVVREAIEANSTLSATRATCLGGLRVVAFEEACNHDLVWEPAQSPDPLSDLPSGWHILTDTVVMSTAVGAFLVDPEDEHSREVALPFRYGAPRYELGDVPFTGRIEFEDGATGDWVRSRDYVAGRCWSQYDSGSCSSLCFYGVDQHYLFFSARPTTGDMYSGDPVPSPPVPLGPLGDWTEYLIVCNDSCGGGGGGGDPVLPPPDTKLMEFSM